MGRAKNLPVGGKDVGGYAASVGVHYRPRGGDPPCRWRAQANAGLRMTALGNAICVCWPVRLREEILPAVGRRKRTPCGAQDDSVRGMLNLFVGVPACGGGRSSLPLAGVSEPPAGVRMTHAGRAE